MDAVLQRFLRNTGGLAVMEFALVLPFLTLILFGVIDVTRYILIVQKTEKLAHSVANVTAQSAVITRATLDQVMNASSDIMNPFATGSNSHIIVSSLYRAAGASTARVSWRYEGGGSLVRTSQLGAVGAIPTMPTNFTFAERENVVAAEVYYQFTPLLPHVWLSTTVVYRTAFYSPRFGALTTTPG